MTDEAMSADQMRTLLQAASAQPPQNVDLLRGVRTATSPARRSHRTISPALTWRGTTAAAGVAGAAALITVAVGIVGVGSAPSAQAQVTAAMDTTAGQSFRVHIVQDNGAVYDGLSDPARNVGMSMQSNGSEWRYIGGTVYAKKTGASLPSGKLWVAQTRPTEDELADVPAEALLLKIAPDDPKAALQRLRATATFTEGGNASGPDWKGTRYAFALAPVTAPDLAKQSRAESGWIDIDDQGWIRQVTFTMAGDPAHGSSALHETMTFSDFGVPVNVTPPPPNEVIADIQGATKSIDKQDTSKPTKKSVIDNPVAPVKTS